MPRLLLDEHLPRAVATQVRVHRPGVEIAIIADWQDGAFRKASDAAILAAARETGWVLVTSDLKTIMPLVREWSARGIPHGGVVFVNRSTFPAHDLGRLIQALTDWLEMIGDTEVSNLSWFLQPIR